MLFFIINRFGHCNVPNNYQDNQALSSWISKQRHQYKLYNNGASCSLTEERIRQLNEIGFDWRCDAKKAAKAKAGPYLVTRIRASRATAAAKAAPVVEI